MFGQDHLHAFREVFAAWNTHDVEAFTRRLDTKVTWESDAQQFPKVYVTAVPDFHLDGVDEPTIR